MLIKHLLHQQTARLQLTSGDLASLEARLLLCYVLKCRREDLILNADQEINPAQQDAYLKLTSRRIEGEPLAKIIGLKEFWGLPFKVTSDTLDPRPDSETLIEGILEKIKPQHILDLGTGTGCLLLSLLRENPGATGVGVDISPLALAVAQENAINLSLANRAKFVLSDWGVHIEGEFDLIVSNPPYISQADYEKLDRSVRDYDPVLALLAGKDGLDCYRKIAPVIHKHLAYNGFFAIEIGIGQERLIEKILSDNNLRALEFRKDLAGIVRCIIGDRH